MTPFEQALAVYVQEPCARTFADDLEAHLRYGLVISTPEYFLMARKVIKDAPPREITDSWFYFNQNLANCWHVWLLAGDIRMAFLSADVRLPWVSFEKRNKIRFYTWESIYKKTERIFRS
jgi:hypothetical protein